MADVLHDVSNTVGSTAASGTHNVPLTIAANSDRYLIAHLFQSDAGGLQPTTATAVVWSGQNLEKLWEIEAFGNQRLECWGLKNPNAGSGNVTFSVNSNVDRRIASASAYYNVDQTTPVGAFLTPIFMSGIASSAPKYVTGVVNAALGDKIVSAIGTHSAATVTTAAVNSTPVHLGNGTAGQANSGTSRSPALNTAATRPVGSTLFAVVGTKNAEEHFCATSGWQKFGQFTHPSNTLTVSVWFYRVTDTTTPGVPAITWASSAANFGQIFSLGDVDYDALGTLLGTPGTGNVAAHASAGGNTLVDKTLAMYLDVCNVSTALATPAGWTEEDDSALGTAAMRFAYGSKVVAVAGSASGAISVVGGVADWIQTQIAFASGGTPQVQRTTAQIGTGALFVSLCVSDENGPQVSTIAGYTAPTGSGNASSMGGTVLKAKVAAVIVTPSLFTSAQAFYGPKLNLKYTASFHQNTQSFPTQKIVRGLKPPLHQNTQAFYGPKLIRTLKRNALHQNTQTFYGPAILQAVLPHILKPAFHQNTQEFYAPGITFAGNIAAPFHQNLQAFYGPTIKRTYKVSVEAHQNLQAFYGPTIDIFVPPVPIFVQPNFHQNLQQFFGPVIFIAPVTHFLAPFHQNRQAFYGPYINITPKPPDGGAKGAIGPFWWAKGIKPDRKKIRAEEKHIWMLPSAAELPPVVMRAPPIVVKTEDVRRLTVQRKNMLKDLEDRSKKRAAHERIVEDQIINAIVKILAEE